MVLQQTAEVLDDIKAMGYKYSTRAAMTVSISEMTVPAELRSSFLLMQQKKVEQITMKYNRASGLTDRGRRYKTCYQRYGRKLMIRLLRCPSSVVLINITTSS